MQDQTKGRSVAGKRGPDRVQSTEGYCDLAAQWQHARHAQQQQRLGLHRPAQQTQQRLPQRQPPQSLQLSRHTLQKQDVAARSSALPTPQPELALPFPHQHDFCGMEGTLSPGAAAMTSAHPSMAIDFVPALDVSSAHDELKASNQRRAGSQSAQAAKQLVDSNAKRCPQEAQKQQPRRNGLHRACTGAHKLPVNTGTSKRGIEQRQAKEATAAKAAHHKPQASAMCMRGSSSSYVKGIR